MQIPGARGAPVTAVLVGCSAATTLLAGSGMRVSSLPFVGLPPFGVFSSTSTALCVAAVFVQCRAWERRKGSGCFLMLCLWPLAVLLCVFRVFGGLVGDPSTARYLRSGASWAHDCGWIATCGALVARFVADVPPPGRRLHQLSDKWLALAALSKLAVFDAFLSKAPLAHLAALCVGIGVGLLAAPSVLGRTKLFDCLDGKPAFETALGAVSTVLCGGQTHVRRARPQPAEEEGADDALRAALAASMAQGAAPAAGQAAAPGAMPRRATQPAQAQPAQRPGVDPAAVDLLMGLGLGCSREEAAQALEMSNGNVDQAAALLMDRH